MTHYEFPESQGTWCIWNDYGTVETGLTEDQAQQEVDRIQKEEDPNVYAEDSITGRLYEGRHGRP